MKPVIAQLDNSINTYTWNLPEAKGYIERNELMKKVTSSWNDRLKVVISGPAGTGKTMLAVLCSHLVKSNSSKAKIIWFTMPTIAADIREFANAHGISDDRKDLFEITQAVFKYLETISNLVIVYDNADSFEQLKYYLPKNDTKIIITSRHTEWPTDQYAIVPIEKMTEDESARLIKNFIFNEKQDVGLNELAKQLKYLPLPLAQAASYIQQHAISVSDYLELYKAKLSAIDKSLEYSDHPAFITSQLAWDKIKITASEFAKLAFLAPDNIDLRSLKNIFNDSSKSIDQFIAILRSYSLIRINDANSQNISIHRVVQSAIQESLKSSDNDLIFISDLMTTFNNLKDGTDKIKLCVPHVANLLDILFNSYKEQINSMIELLASYGDYFKFYAGDYLTLLLKVGNYLCSQEIFYSYDRADYISKIISNLVSVNFYIGAYAAAFEISKKYYNYVLNLLPSLANDVDATKKNTDALIKLSVGYRGFGNQKETEQDEKTSRDAFEISQKHIEEAYKVFAALHEESKEYKVQLGIIHLNWSATLTRIGNYDEAIKQIRVAIAIFEAINNEHYLIRSKIHLVDTQLMNSQFNEANELIHQLPQNNLAPRTQIRSFFISTKFYHSQDKFDQAKVELEKAENYAEAIGNTAAADLKIMGLFRDKLNENTQLTAEQKSTLYRKIALEL